MTVTQVKSDTKNPRELISPELFGKLVERVMEEQPVSETYAGNVVEQTLVFLAAVAQNPTNKMLTPSRAVDPGWHAFLAFTQEYRDFCLRVTDGGFIHHIPVLNSEVTSGRSLNRAVEVMRTTGYPIDDTMWEEYSSCGSTDNCNYFVEHAG